MHKSITGKIPILVLVSILLVPIIILGSCTVKHQAPPRSNLSTPPTSQVTTITTSPNTSTPALTQEIRYTMPPGATSKSFVSYSKYLEAGTEVNMTVELTGEPQETDWSYQWDIQILGPGGESMQQWQGHWMNNNFHPLDFTASYSGMYKVRVGHLSLYPKELVIKVKPAGWGYAGK
jgi:hypothetical protein